MARNAAPTGVAGARWERDWWTAQRKWEPKGTARPHARPHVWEIEAPLWLDPVPALRPRIALPVLARRPVHPAEAHVSRTLAGRRPAEAAQASWSRPRNVVPRSSRESGRHPPP